MKKQTVTTVFPIAWLQTNDDVASSEDETDSRQTSVTSNDSELPSCVCMKIRQNTPEESGVYVGYKEQKSK